MTMTIKFTTGNQSIMTKYDINQGENTLRSDVICLMRQSMTEIGEYANVYEMRTLAPVRLVMMR